MTCRIHSCNAVFEKNVELIKNMANILHNLANLDITPNLIEVCLISISDVLRCYFFKEIYFKKSMCTAIKYFNISTFYFPWLYKNSYGEIINSLTSSLEKYQLYSKNVGLSSKGDSAFCVFLGACKSSPTYKQV